MQESVGRLPKESLTTVEVLIDEFENLLGVTLDEVLFYDIVRTGVGASTVTEYGDGVSFLKERCL